MLSSCNLSWGPVMWVMLGEMFPNQLRGSGLAIAGLAQWLANFLVTLTFPLILGASGLSAAYSLYALGAIISIFFVHRVVPETKGVELEANGRVNVSLLISQTAYCQIRQKDGNRIYVFKKNRYCTLLFFNPF